jgi:hypothetical protein
MDTVQNPAAEKLYKKLTALRVTLPNDEREVFDQIIPAEEEVKAHRSISIKPRAQKKAKKAPEVTAHKLTKTKAKKNSTRKAKMVATK